MEQGASRTAPRARWSVSNGFLGAERGAMDLANYEGETVLIWASKEGRECGVQLLVGELETMWGP